MATALTAAAIVTAGGGAAGAATGTSQAAGRFLSGSAAGQSFDTVAELKGENAKYPGNPGPNSNDLSGSVLGQALAAPLKNISVPFPGGVTFGAVGQYAKASKDGSAVGSSGLIGSNGAINVAGSGNDDVATIDLANLPGASTLTDLVGDLTLKVGAVTGRARQAAFGKTLADPSADCTSGNYQRVSAENHAGSYQFANLTLSATSPLLTQLGTALTGALTTVLSNAKPLADLLQVQGFPSADDLAKAFTVDIADGGITASLVDGSLTIDLAKILKSAGLDINHLCPNTSLSSYLADALAKLPTALDGLATGLVAQLTAAFKNLTIAGTPINDTQLQSLLAVVSPSLQTFQTGATTALDPVLTPLSDALSGLLDLTGNAQDESGGTFTETALQLSLIPGGGSLPTLPSLPTIPGIPLPPLVARVQAAEKAAKNNSTTTSTAKPSAAHSFVGSAALSDSTSHIRLAAAARPLAAPLASTAADDPALELNLGQAAVTNDEAAPASTSPSSSAAANSALPTGVPAGQGTPQHGTPTLPLVLALLGVLIAGAGAIGLRLRNRPGH